MFVDIRDCCPWGRLALCFYHGFTPWLLWKLRPPLDLRFLVLRFVSPVKPVSDHGGLFTSVTREGVRVSQYRAFHATMVPCSLLESFR